MLLRVQAMNVLFSFKAHVTHGCKLQCIEETTASCRKHSSPWACRTCISIYTEWQWHLCRSLGLIRKLLLSILANLQSASAVSVLCRWKLELL